MFSCVKVIKSCYKNDAESRSINTCVWVHKDTNVSMIKIQYNIILINNDVEYISYIEMPYRWGHSQDKYLIIEQSWELYDFVWDNNDLDLHGNDLQVSVRIKVGLLYHKVKS